MNKLSGNWFTARHTSESELADAEKVRGALEGWASPPSGYFGSAINYWRTHSTQTEDALAALDRTLTRLERYKATLQEVMLAHHRDHRPQPNLAIGPVSECWNQVCLDALSALQGEDG